MILRIIILRTPNNTTDPTLPSETQWWVARVGMVASAGDGKKGPPFRAAPPVVPASPLTTERGPPPWRGACRSSSEPTPPCR